MQSKKYAIEIGGREMTAEFTDLAAKAQGSVLMRVGETAVLVTAVMAPAARKGAETIDFVPLTVDYEERFYAAREIMGGSFVRREGKPSEEAILTARAIDRTLRPLFDQRLRYDIQVVALVLSLGAQDPDTLSIIGASLALGASDIPWNGPVSAVRAHTDHFSFIVCGKNGKVIMMEGGGKEIMEKNVGTAIEGALKEVERIQEWQERIIKEIGKPKRELLFGEETQDVRAAGEERARARRAILEKGVRADGRGVDKLRPLFAQKGGFLQGVHGSGLFYRGGTHVLSVLTRDTRDAAQNIETIERRGEKKYFLHHYNSFPFGSGETGRLGSNRRAIGHGALVERALASVVPAPDAYPYTLRLVSEALSSDGSTSMASVCAGTLALQDGGVPIAAPVAGVAMGLVDSTILTDISGAEDHIGDMDLKVAGTRQGITALQMDVKNEGVSPAVIADALTKARVAREKILEMMR